MRSPFCSSNSHIFPVFFFFPRFQGPGWEYETELPEWARVDWHDGDFE